MAEQNRGELRHYISKTLDGPFVRLAKGISSLGSNLNAQEVTRTYIDDSSSTTTTGFQEEWPVDGNIFFDDPAMDLLYDMAVKRAKGADALLYMVVLRKWDDGTAAGSKKAYRQQVTWLPASDGGGDGGGDVTFSGSLRAAGSPVYGEGVITEATESAPEKVVFTPESAPSGGEG